MQKITQMYIIHCVIVTHQRYYVIALYKSTLTYILNYLHMLPEKLMCGVIFQNL